MRNEKTQRGIQIAVNYRIHVYTLDAMSSSFKDPIRTLASPQALNTGGGPESVRERDRKLVLFVHALD